MVEVLSESTEGHDRGEKFAAYRKIEALQEYVLVAQHSVLVERYRRSGDGWTLAPLDSADDVLELASVGAAIPIRDIYEGVDLPAR